MPFAPKTVSLVSLNNNPVLRVGQGFGYSLFSNNYFGHTPLHWTLVARLVAVDRSGRVQRLVDRASGHVRTTSYAGQATLFLHPERRLGFYRYDITIFDRGGEKIATYGKYLRVVHPFWKTRLGLNARSFRPGQTVLSRVENLGSESASYGESFGVERRNGRRWAHDPRLPTQSLWNAWAGMSGPGEAGRCSALKLPADLPEGQYRIIKHVGRVVPPSARGGNRLVASFKVVGHAPLLARAQARLLRLFASQGPPTD